MYAEEYKKTHQHHWEFRVVWGKVDEETRQVS
jgi:hypothetical protein